jgi:hypothetical protein
MLLSAFSHQLKLAIAMAVVSKIGAPSRAAMEVPSALRRAHGGRQEKTGKSTRRSCTKIRLHIT